MRTELTYLETMFNATYQFIAERSDRVYVTFVAEKLDNAQFQSAVANGLLTLNLSLKSCPGLKVEKGVVYAPLTRNGVPTTLQFNLTDVVAFGDGYGNIHIPTQWAIFCAGTAVKVEPEVKVVDNVVSVAFGKKK